MDSLVPFLSNVGLCVRALRPPVLRAVALVIALLAGIAGTTACDWTVEGSSSGGPAIFRVEQSPRPPVAPRDTVQMTVILADSADATLRYQWDLALVSRTVTTREPTVLWIAPDSARTYRHAVTAITGVDTVRTDSLAFETDVEDPDIGLASLDAPVRTR